MMSENYLAEFLDYGKSAVRPKRLKQAFIHHPSGNELLNGFDHLVMNQSDALAIHFRALIMDNVKIWTFV